MDSSKKAQGGRYFGLAFCYGCGALYLAFQGGKVAGMVFAMMTVLGVYLILGRWSGIRKPQIKRQILKGLTGNELEAGTSLTVRLELKIPGKWPIPYVIVKEQLKRENGKTKAFEASFVPDWKRQGKVVYETPPLERGIYTFESTECSTEDVFGLFVYSGTVSLPHTLRVLPRTVPIREWQDFNMLAKGGQHHSVSARAWRETTQINGVRDYVYGDRISRIHWNASARTGEWKSKEFERESLPKMFVVLDAQKEAYDHESKFELAVSTAASLLRFAKQNGLSYGLLTTGKNPSLFPPGEDRSMRKQMTYHLVTVACDGEQPIASVWQESFIKADCPLVMIISPVHPDRLDPLINKIRAENGTGFHLYIRSGQTAPRNDHKFNVTGKRTYMIDTLEQLTHALGGRAR